jgi:4-hydroxybenzoate polyprenyltransferase
LLAATTLALGSGFIVVCMTWDTFRPPAVGFALVLYIFGQRLIGFGPVAVGICHFLNVLLGTSTSLFYVPEYPQAYYFIALIVAIYMAGVSWFARSEASRAPRWNFCRAAGAMLASGVLAFLLPEARRALSHGLFAQFEPQGIPADSWEAALYPYLLLLWSVIIAIPVYRAVREPSQWRMQAVGRTGLFGLISLDALLAFGVIGWPGLLILILLIPHLSSGHSRLQYDATQSTE